MLLWHLRQKKLVDLWELLKLSAKNWISGLLMLFAVRAYCARASQTIVSLCIAVAAGAAIYFGALLLLRDAFLLDNIKKIFSRLKGRGKRPQSGG